MPRILGIFYEYSTQWRAAENFRRTRLSTRGDKAAELRANEGYPHGCTHVDEVELNDGSKNPTILEVIREAGQKSDS